MQEVLYMSAACVLKQQQAITWIMRRRSLSSIYDAIDIVVRFLPNDPAPN
jgi:hypothetical protein